MVKINKKTSAKAVTGIKKLKSAGKKVKHAAKRKIANQDQNNSNYGDMSVDDFLNQSFDDDDDQENDSVDNSDSDNADDSVNNATNEDDSFDETADDDSVDGAPEDEAESHKESLARLKEIDPEFYKFLEENDKKLLNFDASQNEQASEDEEEEDVHVPSEELEVASDESDYESEEKGETKSITLKMLKKWQIDIHSEKSVKLIANLVHAFHAALERVSSEKDQEPSMYKVEGSSVFNAVIQLCILELGPAVKRFLGLSTGSKLPPHKCKKFVKVKTLLRIYFTDLLKLLGGVTSPNILTVLLKHLHYMSSLLVSFPNVSKNLVKRLVRLWSTSDENVRVVAFLCILRITNNQRTMLLDSVLKSMHIAYVKNSKFMSVSSLPGINFMRRSLVEMFAMDVNVSYQHVFLYIRQLAIHLRNAVTNNKKENVQIVCNWQFVNSLRLWGNLLAATADRQQLQPLIYPFVQVCLGTMKLVPTAQYFPLRFHVVQILMDLSKDTGVFIPVLPFLLEVLTTYDFNKKHQKVSMKPLSFTCLLRLSKSQLSENGFKDTVVDTLYSQILEYTSTMSHTIGFPDLSLFCIIQIKQFLKKCSIANYCRKMKQLLEKIDQNSQFIENERKKVSFALSDFKQIEGWESQIRNKGTPLNTFFENWNKIRTIKRNKEATNNAKIGDYQLPAVKKFNKEKRKANEGPVELFPSDSESDEETTKIKPKRGKRGGKNVNKKPLVDNSGPVEDSGDKDIVEDLKLSDW